MPEELRMKSWRVPEWQIRALDEVHERSHVPVSELVRMGIEKILARYGVRPSKRGKRTG